VEDDEPKTIILVRTNVQNLTTVASFVPEKFLTVGPKFTALQW